MTNWGDVPTWLAVAAATGAGTVAGWQLWLQRIQLRDQQDIMRRQTELAERQQADKVDVTVRAIDGADATVLGKDRSEPVHVVAVTNGSPRPIREVTVKLEACSADMSIRHTKDADVYGEVAPYALGSTAQAEAFVLGERASIMPVLRAGHKGAFVWSFTAARYPRVITWVRFTDDAELHWEIDTSLHLKQLEKRDW